MDGKAQNASRSDCPVNFAVENLGDKWLLLIMRDILFWGRRTYGDFLRAGEGIATNILASRLADLERRGLIEKRTSKRDGRKEVYAATELGISLIPLIVEMVAWSAKHPEWHALEPKGSPAQMRLVKRAANTKNKYPTIQKFKEKVRRGGYIFEDFVEREELD